MTYKYKYIDNLILYLNCYNKITVGDFVSYYHKVKNKKIININLARKFFINLFDINFTSGYFKLMFLANYFNGEGKYKYLEIFKKILTYENYLYIFTTILNDCAYINLSVVEDLLKKINNNSLTFIIRSIIDLKYQRGELGFEYKRKN